MLSLDKVGKRYERRGQQLQALSQVTLELGRGDFVGIFGPSGSGKTTLLKIAAGFELPDSGAVEYEGRALAAMSRAELTDYRRNEIACVWGSRCLVPRLSALDNVILPLRLRGTSRRTAERRARDLLEACRVEEAADASPDELSDGERQRVAIAQALVCGPRLLLGDEPASNLDSEESDLILYLLQTQARERGLAVLICDTDPLALMRTSPLCYMKDGTLTNAPPLDALAKVIPMRAAAEPGNAHA